MLSHNDLYLKVIFIQKEGKFTIDHTANAISQESLAQVDF